MKIVINADWGGYSVPKQVLPLLDSEHYPDERIDPHFIEWVEKHEDETDLAVVEIPDDATDYEIEEYDGYESVIAVVDGKIVHL